MELLAELRASDLSAASEAAAAIDAGWPVSSFAQASVEELLQVYQHRLNLVRSLPGAHAAALSRATEELVSRLQLAKRVEIGTVRGQGEHHFIVFRDADGAAVIGVLRVVSKLDVAAERWEQLWAGP